MKVGIDLDGTITSLPELFALLTRALVAAGHEVHVITYREIGSETRVAAELEESGIHYTGLHLPQDFSSPPRWKARVATQLGLDLMIEDSPEVLAAMPSGVQRLWIADPDVFDLARCVRALQ